MQSLFGLPRDKIKDEFILNKEILWELKENHPIMKNWSNFDYSYFVWYAWKNNANKPNILSIKEESSDINQSKVNFWVVRAGGKGEEEKIALDNNVITIAWNELPDLSSLKNKNELKEQYEKILQENDNTIAQNVGQIWSFMREIRVGDLVFLPLLSTKTKNIAICKIVGDYEYKEITKDVKHIRRVEWLNKGIPNNEFDDNARKSFGSGRTVYSISRKDVIKSILNTLEKNGISLPDTGLGIYKDIISNGLQEKIKPILTVLDVANQTYFPVNMIREIEELLVDKKQIIFYGPPGTSKTYVARKFAEYFAQGIENVEIVQFHQSYAYEDFIEGIRPKITPNGDATGFSKQQGLFKKLAEQCSKHPEKRYVLIIDEINRGNISKIFGELIYLLEYRNEAISLTYSPDEKFSIPSNLYIIGTMNSADRSIAFVDYALRRRFYFIDFYSTSNSILENWFKANNVEEEIKSNILNMLGQINEQITQHLGKEYQIGYSFFMLKKLDREKVNQIISYAIIPMLEQYFFGRGEKLDELKHLCSSIFLSPSAGVIPPNPENH